jgi:hypothetical protein
MQSAQNRLPAQCCQAQKVQLQAEYGTNPFYSVLSYVISVKAQKRRRFIRFAYFTPYVLF